MATAPHFHWPTLSSAGGASDSDVAGFGFGAPEMAPPAADTTALVVSPDQRAVAARPRTRRHSSGKQHEKGGGGGGAKKPPQRGLGVAELERLRCGGDPLRELAGAVGGDAQVHHHPLMHCNHLHHHHHAPAFDARYCPPLPVPPSPAPAAPGCGYVHHQPVQEAACGHRAPPALAPEQQYFMDRWGHRMGPGFTPASNGAGGGEHHAQSLLAPEHPSSQSTIWRPAASSCSLQAGHRCDLCARRTMRTFAERGASVPPPSAPHPASSPTAAATAPDYSIYDLAAAMATARQGGDTAFQLVRKRGALMDEAPAKKEVREIEFFPAASTHHIAAGGGGIDGSEFVPPVSSSYFDAGSRAAPEPHLDLSLRL